MLKFIIVLISTLMFGWLMYIVPNNFMQNDIFRIREITIYGKSKKLSRELTNLAKTIYNSNRWQIDLSDIKNYLEKDIRIKEAKIESNSLGKLTISVQEKEPKYYAQIDKNIYLIDSSGEIIGYLKDFEQPNSYFLKVKNKKEIRELMKICNIIDENILKNIVSQIYIKDKNCVEIVLYDKTIIKTNFDVKEEKYKVAENLYYNLSKKEPIEYIDLRFDDFIIKNLGDAKDGK